MRRACAGGLCGLCVLAVAIVQAVSRAHGIEPAQQVSAGGRAFAQEAGSGPAAPSDLRPGEPVPAVPVHDEPHHRQLFQYGPMRILELQIPGGDMSWFHTHEWPVLYVTLGRSQTRTQVLGEEWSGGAGRGGAARGRGAQAGRGGAAGGRGGPPDASAVPRATSTTSYAKQPVTHRLENIGTGLFRAMVVVNETPGDESTSVEAAGFEGEPELTNGWFRAYRIALEAGEKTASHRHHAPVVIFQVTDGTGLGAGAMKWEFNEPGQWAFFDAEDVHEIRNTGNGRLELIEVEVRRK